MHGNNAKQHNQDQPQNLHHALHLLTLKTHHLSHQHKVNYQFLGYYSLLKMIAHQRARPLVVLLELLGVNLAPHPLIGTLSQRHGAALSQWVLQKMHLLRVRWKEWLKL